ncbi:pilus assembly protein [Coralliovum pocilloporae]|uniref:pilus assembly protein n=1 Tax=Coralliovum pocilloporae TaxID=3066369 RepID=UPI003306E4C3
MSFTLKSLFKRFRHDERGAVVIMFAPISLMLIISVGAAIDYTRLATTRNTIQDLADAMAIASTRGLLISESEARNEASRVFDSNQRYYSEDMNLRFNRTSDLEITNTIDTRAAGVTVHAEVKTVFSGLLSLQSVDFSVFSRSEVNEDNIEIVLVLDVSGSMSGTKIKNLRTAAADFMNIIFGEKSTADNIRITVIPYSGNVRFPAGYGSWLHPDHNPNASFNGCFQVMGSKLEKYNGQTNISRVSARQMTLYSGIGGMRRDYLDSGGSSSTRRHGARRTQADAQCLTRSQHAILAFSNSKSRLVNYVRNLQTEKRTATDIAMSWARRFTSQTWRGRFLESGQYPQNRNDAKKIIVLMTDGAIYHGSTRHDRGDHGYSTGKAGQFFDSVCSLTKTDGVEIFTIGYSVSNSTLLNQLKRCATTVTDHYFNPSIANLKKTFETIGKNITELRLTN